jgi:hypothetical protein
MKNIPFVIGDSQEPRQAKAILNRTMKLLDEKDPTFVECFNQIHRTVMAGCNAVQANDYQ